MAKQFPMETVPIIKIVATCLPLEITYYNCTRKTIGLYLISLKNNWPLSYKFEHSDLTILILGIHNRNNTM